MASRARIRLIGRFLVLLTAFITTLGVATYSGVTVVNAMERQSTTTTYSMQVGDMTRSWDVIAPTAPLPKSAPIIVVLSGVDASTNTEISRDNFVPYVNADKFELVYPVSYRESWNAGGCCSYAAAADSTGCGEYPSRVQAPGSPAWCPPSGLPSSLLLLAVLSLVDRIAFLRERDRFRVPPAPAPALSPATRMIASRAASNTNSRRTSLAPPTRGRSSLRLWTLLP